MARHLQQRARTQPGTIHFVVVSVLMLLAGFGTLFWIRSSTPPVAVDATAPSRLVTSSDTVDLGNVPFDKVVEARFELANSGGGLVRLTGNPKVQMLEGC